MQRLMKSVAKTSNKNRNVENFVHHLVMKSLPILPENGGVNPTSIQGWTEYLLKAFSFV